MKKRRVKIYSRHVGQVDSDLAPHKTRMILRVLNQTRLASTAYGGKQPVRSVRKHKLEVEKGEEA